MVLEVFLIVVAVALHTFIPNYRDSYLIQTWFLSDIYSIIQTWECGMPLSRGLSLKRVSNLCFLTWTDVFSAWIVGKSPPKCISPAGPIQNIIATMFVSCGVDFSRIGDRLLLLHGCWLWPPDYCISHKPRKSCCLAFVPDAFLLSTCRKRKLETVFGFRQMTVAAFPLDSH